MLIGTLIGYNQTYVSYHANQITFYILIAIKHAQDNVPMTSHWCVTAYLLIKTHVEREKQKKHTIKSAGEMAIYRAVIEQISHE